VLVLEWGNGGTPPDPDRRYGSPSDLDAAFRGRLAEAGYKIVVNGQSATSITLRLTPQNRALCDSMEGTNSDYSCHTVSRGVISFSSTEASAKMPQRIDVSPRCADSKVSMSMAGFGRYAADLLIYALASDPKPARPTMKC
jgi:hypothetical protein